MKLKISVMSLTLVAFVLFTSLLAVMAMNAPAAAAPAAQTTQSQLFIFANSRAITQGTFYGDTNDVSRFNTSEAQYAIDQSDVNTTSLYLQASNDRRIWTDVALVTANVADGDGFLTPAILGKYNRLKMTTANTLPVTVTFNLLAKVEEAVIFSTVTNVTVLTVTVD